MDIFSSLNAQQKEAVKHTEGPSVILAGAGSGKTRVLIHKVLHLIHDKGVNPKSIVMITFTNKAAKEMKERIAQAMGEEVTLGYVGTFHSFCCMILRRSGEHIGIPRSFVIYDQDDQKNLINKILKKKDRKESYRYFSHKISEAKNQLIEPEKYLNIFAYYKAAQVADIYYEYQKQLKKNNALDFDDLIMKAVELFRKHEEVLAMYQDRYRYLLVDEFQDTNYAQYVFTKKLAQKYKNITAVGDFSQSIYSWRGADIRNLETFSVDFPDSKTFHLEQNYRSTQNILDFAYHVISENQSHPVLHLRTDNQAGEDVDIIETENEEEEALQVAYTIEQLEVNGELDAAVLYRTNAQSRAIEEVLLHRSIPYSLIGGVRFYERKEIKDVLSYLRLFLNPTDSIATDRIKKLGKRRWQRFQEVYQSYQNNESKHATVDLMELIFTKVGYLDKYDANDEEDFSRLENIRELKSVAMSFPVLSEFLEQVALVESEYFQGEQRGLNAGLKLMTLHQAKGLEFDHVFIVGVEEGILPHAHSIDDVFKLEEERRLFYVGVTRAREKLYISHAKRRTIFGRKNYGVKSRFIRTGEEGDEWW
ncbi:UvrD-helicase domain-containing protein [Candidatus Woesebacteria bacterium]|nr:UvrD-helicase domain-containing protein [Candidatus Woesebacteria bacterium]